MHQMDKLSILFLDINVLIIHIVYIDYKAEHGGWFEYDGMHLRSQHYKQSKYVEQAMDLAINQCFIMAICNPYYFKW